MSRGDATDVSAGLLASYSAAWSQLQAVQATILSSRSKKRAARHLAALAHNAMDDLDDQTQNFLNNRWSAVYVQGAIDADPGWKLDKQAMTVISAAADDLSVRLYGATSGIVRSATKLARRAIFDQQVLIDSGISSVIYRNGSRVGLESYSAMLVRTTTSMMYNQASISAGKTNGAQYFSCADGPVSGHVIPQV